MVYHSKDSLSQNFIKYPRLVTELLDSADLSPDDLVIEIGSGKGIITRQLAARVRQVIAVEKDSQFFDSESGIIQTKDNITFINQDFLNFPLPIVPHKIVANLPFNSTAKIITHILQSPLLPDSLYLIMQLETAQKFMGIPTVSQSSVSTLPFYEIKILGDIDRTNFTSKPQVKIVFVYFKKRPLPFIQDTDRSDFHDFVIYGFNQWQPTLLKAYKKVFTFPQLTTLKKIYKLAELSPGEVSFDVWLQLFKTFKRLCSEDKKDIVRDYQRQYKKQMQNY